MSGLNKDSSFPLVFSFSLGSLFSSLGIFLKTGNSLWVFFCLVLVLLISFSWAESFFIDSALDNNYMMDSLVLGMVLFLLSEALFFVSFFWSWFDFKWSANVQSGNSLLTGITPILPSLLSIPVLNTCLLVLGGLWLSTFHDRLLSKKLSLVCLVVPVILTLFFLFLQLAEYRSSSFSMSHGVYGGLFFLLTGFHGLHVTLSAILLILCLSYFKAMGSNNKSHNFFKFSAYYYHFVDLIWLLLVILVYF